MGPATSDQKGDLRASDLNALACESPHLASMKSFLSEAAGAGACSASFPPALLLHWFRSSSAAWCGSLPERLVEEESRAHFPKPDVEIKKTKRGKRD